MWPIVFFVFSVRNSRCYKHQFFFAISVLSLYELTNVLSLTITSYIIGSLYELAVVPSDKNLYHRKSKEQKQKILFL